MGGYPRWGTPPAGVPPWPGPMGGTRAGPGYGTPPSWIWLGYPPLGVDRQTDGWMDGQTRVKTLPSRRTTCAVGKYFDPSLYWFGN